MDFISRSACHASQPYGVSTNPSYERPLLLARLMQERHVARFIVAPDGLGKTTLAQEYAQVVFSYDHTFWINCRNPCFLRDLDTGRLAAKITDTDNAAALVVFDDIGQLNEHRVEQLSAAIDDLLRADCEVLATVNPFNDAFAKLQSDRVTISAKDLLLSDSEVEEYPCSENKAFVHVDDKLRRRALRVPFLAWNSDNDASLIAVIAANEEHPLEMTCALFGMLVMGSGPIESLRKMNLLSEWALERIERHYPSFMIDGDRLNYYVGDVPVNDVLQAFSSHLENIALHARMGQDKSQDELSAVSLLMMNAADALLNSDKASRACEIMSHCPQGTQKMQWLEKNNLALLRKCCAPAAIALYESIPTSYAAKSVANQSFQALRLALLKQSNRAQSLALAVLTGHHGRHIPKSLSWAVAMELSDDQQSKQLVSMYEDRLHLPLAAGEATLADALLECESDAALFSFHLALITRSSFTGFSEGIACFHAQYRAIAGSSPHAIEPAMRGMLLGLAWHVLRYPQVSYGDEDAKRALDILSAFVVRQREHPAYVEHVCMLALEELSKRGWITQEAIREILLAYSEVCRIIQQQINEQSSMLLTSSEQKELNDQGIQFLASSKDALSNSMVPKTLLGTKMRFAPVELVPKLDVAVFGGLTVYKEGRPLNEGYFSRQKVKTLFTLLAVNLGREVSRDRILSEMWPASLPYSARRNLYTLWGLLRQTLAEGTGPCPYLVKLPNGYKLDERYVNCNARRLEELCRLFSIGRVDVMQWVDLLDELKEIYCGELLPGETKNETIIRLRNDYRRRVADALVTAAQRLIAERAQTQAVWFARSALHIDNIREDAYVALMEAQLALGQRTAALETYNECRTVLARELGIDPSVRAVEMYRMIIEEEALLERW